MDIPPLTIAQLKTCTHLPEWLAPWLVGRPDEQLVKVLYKDLCEADSFRLEFPAIVGVCSLIGFIINPYGLIVGGLGGMLYALAVRPGRRAPAGSAGRFLEWLQQPGPPLTEPLEKGEWLDRRYPTSEALPLREVRMNAAGKASEVHFRFHGLDVRCCLPSGQITVVHPNGDHRRFAGTVHYSPDIIVFVGDLGLHPQLDGRLRVTDKDPWSAGYHAPYCEDTGVREIDWSQALDRLPFPPEWLPPEAVVGEACLA